MNSPASHVICALSALTTALSVSAASFEVDTLPPAGLYRVETDSQMALPSGGSRTQTETATGVTDRTMMGNAFQQQTYGKAPTTQCIGTEAQQLALASKMGANCPVHTERRGTEGLVLSMQCNGMSTLTTVKRTSETTWTYDVVMNNSVTGAAPSSPQAAMERKIADIERVRQLAQASGQSGANTLTDAQVAQMKQQMQQQLDQQTPAQRAAMQAAYARSSAGGSVPIHGLQRYTRIGNTCSAG